MAVKGIYEFSQLAKIDIFRYCYLHFTRLPPWWELECNCHDTRIILATDSVMVEIDPLFGLSDLSMELEAGDVFDFNWEEDARMREIAFHRIVNLIPHMPHWVKFLYFVGFGFGDTEENQSVVCERYTASG